MSSKITKDTIDKYLSEVAKEYRRHGGKALPAEIVIIGGASVLINYGFRNMTVDIDAIIHASSAMKDAITKIGDKYSLPYGWLNDDFSNTSSFSDKILQYSKYYKTFSNVLTVRTVSDKYLLAMKLVSARPYKKDQSDIVGIVKEIKASGGTITVEDVKQAAIQLYGTTNAVREDGWEFLNAVIAFGDYEALYNTISAREASVKTELIRIAEDYPSAITRNNFKDVVKTVDRKEQGINDLIISIENQPLKKLDDKIAAAKKAQEQNTNINTPHNGDLQL